MITALVLAAILLFINELLFWIEAMLCRIVDLLYDMFEVFAGIKTILYEGSPNLLLDVFFENDVVTVVYWGMACIGIVLTFVFAVGSVLKKMFDSTGEKVKATYGMILTNVFKSILLILLMTAIVSATITATTVLLQAVDEVFDTAESATDSNEIVFTDNQRATMYRILSVIGNYSINPSFNNRYSINSCFNDIQNDLNLLAKERVFDFTYAGQELSWQYALREIYVAAGTDSRLYIDVYNEELTNAMLACANRIKTNASFKPIESYSKNEETKNQSTSLGRTIMVSGTMRAAKNGSYNSSGSVDDALRAPYYYGQKDVYDYDTVKSSFNIKLSSWDHVVILVVAYVVIKELAKILINAIARIFNIILLYITAPGFIAVMPLDDGGKFKQWTTAFVIQSLSIFGSFMAVRLMVIFIPIIMSGKLILFPNSAFQNVMAKIVLVVGVCFTAEKASGMISGILADNAGYQSIMAGDVGNGMVEKGMSVATGLAKSGAKLGFKAATGALGAISDITGLSAKGDKLKEGMKNMGQSVRDKGLFGAAKSGWSTNAMDKEKAEGDKKEADKRDQQEFQSAVLDKLSNLGAPPQPSGDKGNQPDITNNMGKVPDAPGGGENGGEFQGGGNHGGPHGGDPHKPPVANKPPVTLNPPPKTNFGGDKGSDPKNHGAN